MEKKLLILGMLASDNGICPYLMSEDFEGTQRIGLRLRKANAHRLMSEMIKLGWVESSETKSGKNYKITSEGLQAFENLQRRRLASFTPSEVPNAIALNHLHLMTEDEASQGLKERLKQLRGHIAILDEVPKEQRAIKGGIELLYRQHLTELAYVEELMERYAVRKDAI